MHFATRFALFARVLLKICFIEPVDFFFRRKNFYVFVSVKSSKSWKPPLAVPVFVKKDPKEAINLLVCSTPLCLLGIWWYTVFILLRALFSKPNIYVIHWGKTQGFTPVNYGDTNFSCILIFWGGDDVVVVVTRLRNTRSGVRFLAEYWEFCLLLSYRPSLEPIQPAIRWLRRALSLGVKQTYESDGSPSPIPVFKSECSHNSTSPYSFVTCTEILLLFLILLSVLSSFGYK